VRSDESDDSKNEDMKPALKFQRAHRIPYSMVPLGKIPNLDKAYILGAICALKGKLQSEPHRDHIRKGITVSIPGTAFENASGP
jgi:hypothetical protein